MPCKGPDHNLDRNIKAALEQDYQDYELLLVTDSERDPAYSTANTVLSKNTSRKAQLCITDSHGPTGKISALLTAIKRTRGTAEVYAFMDSDALVQPAWLANLVDPLAEPSIGSTTGFRWYFPDNGFWSHVESEWNASGSNLFFDEKYNFPWGGAMAVRSSTLDEIDIEKTWADAVSDDLSLNMALRRHGYRIQYLPQCTVSTFNRDNLMQFIGWASRQVAITRMYHRRLWNYAFAAYTYFDSTFLLGVASVFFAVYMDSVWWLPATLLLIIPTTLGVLRSLQRRATFKRVLPEMKDEFDRSRLFGAVASLIVPWVMIYCLLKSTRMKSVEWRGRTYKLTL